MSDKKVRATTLVEVTVEVRDDQPYDEASTVGAIHEAAGRRAIERVTSALYSRAGAVPATDIQIKGKPRVRAVIASAPEEVK